MRNKFFYGGKGRGIPTAKSLTTGRTWQRMLALFALIVTLGIGQMWADTEIFSFTVTSSTTAIKSDYTATGGIAGCSGSAMATGGSNEITVGTQTFYKFNSSSQWTFTLSSGEFAVGDVISFTCAANASSAKSGKGVKINNSIAVTGDFPKGESNVISYTVIADDGVAEENSFYIKRNDSDIKFGSVTVTRPAPSCSTEITTQPSGATLAVGDANPELSIVATHAASYAWKESSDGTSYNGASTLSSTATFTPEVNDAVQTKYYYCEVTSDCDGTSVVKSNIVTVNVVGSIAYYTVTLVPAGGTIVDATGWTLNAGNYEKEVAEGTELTLPTFTKENRNFKTWRKSGPADVESPVTVNSDLTLTAVWTATVENVIYSWEGAEGGATEVGGTVTGSTDGLINQVSAGYYCLKIDGNNSYSGNLVTITLSGEEKVKTGDKIKYWGFYNKSSSANARPKMRDANGSNAQIFDDGTNLPNLYDGTGVPAERTFTVPAGINTNAVQLTRSQTGSNTWIPKLQIIREVQVEEGDLLTVTFNSNGGSAVAAVQLASGQAVAKPADPTKAHNRFNGWKLAGSAYNFATPVTSNITLDADWTQLYTVTYAKGAEDATGDAPTQDELAAGEKFDVAANSFTYDGYDFSTWNDGLNNFDPGMEYTMGSANVTLTAQWVTAATKYEITKGTHTNGNITIDLAEQSEGGTVTLTATPDEDYVFGAWDVYKTGESSTKVTVAGNNTFTMPAYGVTVNATFVADPRQKVLYVTATEEETVKANDKLYAALKDIYNVKIVGPASDAVQSGYALVVLHESVGGNSYNATAVAAAKAGNVPVLNTKAYFYNDGRWGWGAPNAGKSVKGATMNSAYCNIVDHPLFSGVTMTDGFFEITDAAADKCMQPIGSFAAGKEGYTLATTPNAESGDGCAIHELTPAQRGASAGKYMMISVSNGKLDALNANGQKLFQNAAAYLIGSTSWDPIAAPASATVTASPSSAYAVGDNIALTASATGVSAATTYTWYKGSTWSEAETAGAIQAAATAASGGNTFGIADCVLGDAGIYWCVISNGTDCEAKASLEVTVVDASYSISFSSAHGTAPSATTGVSYTLPELTESGWAHQGWTADVNVFVDLEEVVAGTTIANGKMAVFGADVTFTAVWAEVFEVTFNLQGHGAAIAAQDILDGGKVAEPAEPFVIGYDFGGWFTDAECTAGNEWDFANDVVSDDTELFAKWTAFDGCAILVPALSGDAPTAKNQAIDLQSGSFGGAIKTAGAKDNKWSESFAYTANGFGLQKGGADSLRVELNSDMKVGTVIKVKFYAADASSRGLYLKNLSKTTKMEMTQTEVGAKEYTYTVEEGDGLAGTNAFLLSRNNTVYLQSVKVSNCGAAIVYHNLTSAVDPADKGTVTLGATSVREGYTTTATYSDIDPLYEFVNWTVSGEGASIDDATANPAVITMGTEDAVVTLNLQLIPVKYTVNYYDGASLMGSELVVVNEHPTASEIATAKRHYTFQGWSETDGGSVVALNTITSDVAATINLYAVYEPIACPASGTIFSMEFDDDKRPSSTVKVAKSGGTLDLSEYAIISGGVAIIKNTDSSDKDAISTDGKFKLVATKEVMKIELECVLQVGDIIRIPDNNAKYVISTSDSKTGTYQAQTSSQHEFAVTADWIGVDDIYVLYDGSSLNFTEIEVYRPAKFDVSFNMMGHGSAIADIEDVLEGSKITAPAAPTDEDYSFAGWYKENTLENEWDFDNDVVNAATTLYAKWLDKSDATLKSLKYGGEDIALEDGVYEYNISLPSATASVPALTAVPNNPNAVAAVVNATEFDGDGKATSTVVVTPEKEGAATQTYTVNFTKLAELPQVNVTEAISWDFSLAGSTSLEDQTNLVLANLPGITNDATFNSQALKGTFNKMPGNYFQGSMLTFTTEVAGVLTIEFGGTNNKARVLKVYDAADNEIAAWDYNSGTHQTKKVFVTAGKVTLKAFEGSAAQNARIYNMDLSTTAGYTRNVTNGLYGTICLPNGGVMVGATLFEVAYYGGTSEKIFFDEVLDGVMEAGVPYIFLPREGASKLSVYYTDSENASAGHKNGLYGTLTEMKTSNGTMPYDGTISILYNNMYVRVNSNNCTLPANRAYLKVGEITPIEPALAPGRRRISIGGVQSPTGLDAINADAEQAQKMLIDGKIYIIRGGHVYDAAGQLVK